LANRCTTTWNFKTETEQHAGRYLSTRGRVAKTVSVGVLFRTPSIDPERRSSARHTSRANAATPSPHEDSAATQAAVGDGSARVCTRPPVAFCTRHVRLPRSAPRRRRPRPSSRHAASTPATRDFARDAYGPRNTLCRSQAGGRGVPLRAHVSAPLHRTRPSATHASPLRRNRRERTPPDRPTRPAPQGSRASSVGRLSAHNGGSGSAPRW